mgnify:CR=1 FL=1
MGSTVPAAAAAAAVPGPRAEAEMRDDESPCEIWKRSKGIKADTKHVSNARLLEGARWKGTIAYRSVYAANSLLHRRRKRRLGTRE